MKKRTRVYIDGNDLYYGLLKDTPWKWLDLPAFVAELGIVNSKEQKMSRVFPILTVAVCALASAALADDTLAPADNAVFGKALADQPTAPEKYRRPKDWKPSAPYPKTLKEIARDHSAETMARAKAQMEKVNAVNRSGKYAATGLGMDRHKCPDSG